MIIQQTEFVTSAAKPNQWPEPDRPEVAFCGRSNVGKSSLINCLVNRKKLVRTSSTPGRTQLVNFFDVNNQLYLVDLPGYGYAKAPISVRDQWAQMIRAYLEKRHSLEAVVHILDARHKPSVDDLAFMNWLLEAGIPAILVATKMDKIKQSRRVAAIKALSAALPETSGLPIPFSSVNRMGREKLWIAIEAAAGL